MLERAFHLFVWMPQAVSPRVPGVALAVMLERAFHLFVWMPQAVSPRVPGVGEYQAVLVQMQAKAMRLMAYYLIISARMTLLGLQIPRGTAQPTRNGH